MGIVRLTKLKGTDVNSVASKSAFNKEWCWPVRGLFFFKKESSYLILLLSILSCAGGPNARRTKLGRSLQHVQGNMLLFECLHSWEGRRACP